MSNEVVCGQSWDIKFESELCNECIARISYLQELIEIEEEKLFKELEKMKLQD